MDRAYLRFMMKRNAKFLGWCVLAASFVIAVAFVLKNT